MGWNVCGSSSLKAAEHTAFLSECYCLKNSTIHHTVRHISHQACWLSKALLVRRNQMPSCWNRAANPVPLLWGLRTSALQNKVHRETSAAPYPHPVAAHTRYSAEAPTHGQGLYSFSGRTELSYAADVRWPPAWHGTTERRRPTRSVPPRNDHLRPVLRARAARSVPRPAAARPLLSALVSLSPTQPRPSPHRAMTQPIRTARPSPRHTCASRSHSGSRWSTVAL